MSQNEIPFVVVIAKWFLQAKVLSWFGAKNGEKKFLMLVLKMKKAHSNWQHSAKTLFCTRRESKWTFREIYKSAEGSDTFWSLLSKKRYTPISKIKCEKNEKYLFKTEIDTKKFHWEGDAN